MSEEKENYMPTVTDNSPASMMQIALSRGADLDKLEKMLALQERWEANEARKAYHTAMAAFKAAPPEIEKDKKVSFGAGKACRPSVDSSRSWLTTITCDCASRARAW